MSRRRRVRTTDDRGAVLVEAAFVIPILVLLVFGIIEFGFAFGKKLNMAESARAGARLGAAQPRTVGYEDAIATTIRETLVDSVGPRNIEYLTIFKADPATGEPVDGTVTTCTTCYRFAWDADAEAWTEQAGSQWLWSSQAACGGVDNTDYIGIYVAAKHELTTGVLPVNDFDLHEQVIMRLEPVPLDDECEPIS